MSIGLIGKKIGMTREFFDSGVSVHVTVLSIEKGRIIDIITNFCLICFFYFINQAIKIHNN